MVTLPRLALVVALAFLPARGYAAEPAAEIVAAPNTPVKLASVKVLNAGAEPLVLLYAAANATDGPIEQFTVTAYVFDAQGNLKARQVAPGRRELKVGETKYSAMVLDVGAIGPTDFLMAGVDQVQRAGSEDWWRADLRAIAEAVVDTRRGAPRR